MPSQSAILQVREPTPSPPPNHRVCDSAMPDFLEATANQANHGTTSTQTNQSTTSPTVAAIIEQRRMPSLPMPPVTVTPTKEEALAKLREQCEAWGVSNVTKQKFTELLDLLNSAMEEAVAIPALRR